VTIFFYILGAALMAWFSFRMIKSNPGVFPKESLGRSFYTLGILALILIAVIVICVKLTSVQ